MSKYSTIGQIFYNDLFENNPFDGYVFFYIKRKIVKNSKASEAMQKIHFCKTSEVNDYLKSLDINNSFDYYFTVNSFKNPKGTTVPNNRKNNLFAINSIVIDIDCHTSKKSLEAEAHKLKDLIELKTSQYQLPFFNYIVFTGRGIQVYYLIKPCYYNRSFLVNMVRNKLIEFYKLILLDIPKFHVDISASGRDSGLFRMPYTTNQKAHADSYFMYWEEPIKRDISEMLDKIGKSKLPSVLEYNKIDSISIEENETVFETNPNISRCKKVLLEVEKYQADIIKEEREHENRNRTIFVYCSFLLHLYSTKETLQKLIDFNKRYNNPLPVERLTTIEEYLYENHYDINKKKYLYLKNKTILSMLEISSGQYNIIVTDDYKYQYYTNDIEKIEANKKEKATRNLRIEELLKHGYSLTDISKMTGISIPTISRVAKQKHINKNKPLKPWEELGIPRSTYYYKKNQRK